MPRAEVYLEDVEAPALGASVRFVFPDGFKPDSPAHQLANILRFKLDEMAQNGELQALDERSEQGDMVAANDALQGMIETTDGLGKKELVKLHE